MLTPDDIADASPARLRLGLQPYLTLLALDWPVDDYVIAVKKRDTLRHEASHVVDHGPCAAARKKVPVPQRGRVFVVVHRYNQKLYYKRVEAPAFKILSALHAGRTLAQAITASRSVTQEQVREWFTTWAELGWFCRAEQSKSARPTLGSPARTEKSRRQRS